MILASGCSFTWDPLTSWTRHIRNHSHNLARPGVGNEYITADAIRRLATERYQAAVIQLTISWRLDILVSTQDPHWDRARRSRAPWDTEHEYYGLRTEKLRVLRTTDQDHQWWANTPAGRLVAGVERAISRDQRMIRTLEALHRLQLYTRSQRIPTFIFWGWRDCLGPADVPELVDPVRELIDWTQVYETPMAEWMLERGYVGKLDEDHINTPPRGWTELAGVRKMVGHPEAAAQRAFAHEVIQPWLDSQLGDTR